MYLTVVLFVSLTALTALAMCNPPDPRDFYSNVGPCTDNILQKAVQTFDIKEIANTGDYVYLFSTGLQDVDCATAEIHGDDVITYRGTITQYKGGKGVTTAYSLDKINNGVIDETLAITNNGATTKYEFKIVVLGWDKQSQVFYYGRCSEKGTATTDSRAIVVTKCASPSNNAKVVLNKFRKLDKSYSFNGDLLRVKQCTKRKVNDLESNFDEEN